VIWRRAENRGAAWWRVTADGWSKQFKFDFLGFGLLLHLMRTGDLLDYRWGKEVLVSRSAIRGGRARLMVR